LAHLFHRLVVVEEEHLEITDRLVGRVVVAVRSFRQVVVPVVLRLVQIPLLVEVLPSAVQTSVVVVVVVQDPLVLTVLRAWVAMADLVLH
jgi:hypothetical protein